MMPEELHQKTKPLVHGLCGSIASCFATVVCQPLDILRTRLVAQGEPRVHPHTLQFSNISIS